MTTLSPRRLASPIYLHGRRAPLHRGKVRDTYPLQDDLRLLVTTDCISIFDFSLNAVIPHKGSVLTVLSHFWFKYLEKHGYTTHLVDSGRGIDRFLPESLRAKPELQSRSLVVKSLEMIPIEFIARSCLAGSALKWYKRHGNVFGHSVPMHLHEGDAFPSALFTPSTKADEGHDLPLNPFKTSEDFPEETSFFMGIFHLMSTHLETCGIKLVDTKCELGKTQFGKLSLADECGTPDSSRLWDLEEWRQTRVDTKQPPPSLDKQFVRAWGITHGIHKLNPMDPEAVRFVHSLELPDDVIRETSRIYEEVCERIIGKPWREYLHSDMGALT